MIRPLLLPFLCLAAALGGADLRAHDHYAAGIVDTNGNQLPDAGEPLELKGPNGEAKILHLLPRPAGFRPVQRCGGYYMLDERPRTLHSNDAFSFTALSDGQIEAATPGHAHTGAQIWVEILAVAGPDGAKFGFWDADRSFSHDTPTIFFPTNEDAAPYAFVLSEGPDFPDEDPQGHIHGRSWTATMPGDYHLSFRLVDLSTSGPGGGPWHTPSRTYIYHFRAGPSFQPAGQFVPGTGFKITWESQMGTWDGDAPPQSGVTFTIQRSTALTPESWETLGTVTGTTADIAHFTDSAPPPTRALYRLEYEWTAD